TVRLAGSSAKRQSDLSVSSNNREAGTYYLVGADPSAQRTEALGAVGLAVAGSSRLRRLHSSPWDRLPPGGKGVATVIPNKNIDDRVKDALIEPDAGHFRVAALKQLADQQLRFALPAHRQQRMIRAERLFNEIDPERSYPYQYVYYRITDFRTEDYPSLLIPGEDLRHDLWPFIDRLAKSLPRTEPAAPLEDIGERVLTLDEISRQLNVSTKTISRWRHQGLVGRRVLQNGRWQLGFPQSVVDRFLKDNADRVERGSRFSQLSDDEKTDILRRAKR